jgi:L-threonylcarbamoyladenylate synthase
MVKEIIMIDFENDIEQCLKVLKNGGIILYPTDTIWGIGCDATNSKAVARIYELKMRADNKAMIVLVSEEREVLQYTAGPDMRVFDHLQKTNKPTTVIYDGAIGLADNLTGPDGTVGIRICEDLFCRHLIKRLRKPIVSTSANVSGEKPALVFADISAEIKNGVDYVVNYRQDEKVIGEPSSVIKWNKDGTITVLR